MQLIEDMKQHSFPVNEIAPTVRCRFFVDNSEALKMATNHKYRPRNKYPNVKLHQFRDYVTHQENLI